MSATRLATRRAQRGAAMVEMAITLSLFLMLVFAIIEFSMAYFTWARINEAARDAARYAIVNDPLADISGLSCPGTGEVDVTCTDAACADLMTVVHRVAPFVEAGQVHVRYGCSGAGNPERPAEMVIPEVTVEIRDVQYEFIVPVLLGVDSPMGLPTARAARTGEDLFTEDSGS